MSLADKVREYAYANYITLAKDSGKDTVTIKSGDIHDGMGLEKQDTLCLRSFRYQKIPETIQSRTWGEKRSRLWN